MSLIGRFEHLPKRPRSEEARPLLEKIASQVKPIMSKRDWKVGTLAEFLPSNPSLLGNNMNHGQRINLRLRPPGSEGTFYEYDQLVLVMLHELTHIVFGPHDANFYKLLAELEEEYYELKRKGFSGEGFHGRGNNLAGIRRDEYAGRLTGLAAAEKRLATQRKIGKGGILGGKTTAGRSIREVLAEAAERRIKDDKTCAAGGSLEVEQEVKKAQEESVGVDAIDLTGSDAEDEVEVVDVDLDISRDGTGPAKSGSASRPQPQPIGVPRPSTIRPVQKTANSPYVEAMVPGPSTLPSSRKNSGPRRVESSRTNSLRASAAPVPPIPAQLTSASPPTNQTLEWSCPTCTLLNPLHHLSCDACTTERPPQYATPTSRHLQSHSEKPLRRVGTGPDQTVYGVGGKGAGIGIAEGWFCGVCGEGPGSWERWSCEGCGVVRTFG